MLSLVRWSQCRPLVHHVRLASNSASALRRGRNLTERYRTLENTTRTKPERATHVSGLSELQSDKPVPSTRPNTIASFVIPQEPRAPADDECCMSGCAVCVYDLYEEALAAYKDSIMTLCAALSARHIPESEWPAHIRTGNATQSTPSATTAEKSKSAVLDAFEEMERALKEKQKKRAEVEAESSS